MIKYDIKNFEEFFTSISIGKPVYIEKNIDYNPIPELQGFIYPFSQDGIMRFVTVVIDDNTHMKPDVFKRMIISCNIREDTMIKVFELTEAISIYKYFKNEYNLFVLDSTYDVNIENNN